MNKSTFDYLCGELAPIIQRQTTHLRNPIDVDKRVAITLWWLATNVDYRTLAQLSLHRYIGYVSCHSKADAEICTHPHW